MRCTPAEPGLASRTGLDGVKSGNATLDAKCKQALDAINLELEFQNMSGLTRLAPERRRRMRLEPHPVVAKLENEPSAETSNISGDKSVNSLTYE